MFDINNLTLGQIKEISSLINSNQKTESSGLGMMVGKKVIIRTYSAVFGAVFCASSRF